MDVRFPRYAPIVLFVSAAAVAACDSNGSSPTSPAPMLSTRSALAVEPRVARPEFLHTGSCTAAAPFGLRLRIILSGQREFILRSLRFRLTDSFGVTALPEVTQIPSGPDFALPPPTGAAFTTMPIPIPGVAPFSSISVSAGTSQTLPFFLRFACGVAPEGTLLIVGDIGGPDGPSEPSRLSVRVIR